MNSLTHTVGRSVIAATLLSLSLSAAAHDSGGMAFASKAPHAHAPHANATAPAAYPESWSERVAQSRRPELARGQGEGCDRAAVDTFRTPKVARNPARDC